MKLRKPSTAQAGDPTPAEIEEAAAILTRLSTATTDPPTFHRYLAEDYRPGSAMWRVAIQRVRLRGVLRSV